MNKANENFRESEKNFLSERLHWKGDQIPLLYPGGAALNSRVFMSVLASGRDIGSLDSARRPLVSKIVDVLEGRLRAGGSPIYAKIVTTQLKSFYAWADIASATLTLANVADQFLNWSDYLNDRRRAGAIKSKTAYGYAAGVASVLDEVLGLEIGLMRSTRLTKGSRERPWRRHGADSEKTFQFGNTLCDICNALTAQAIRGKLPIVIRFRTGELIEHWSGKRDPETLKTLKGKHSNNKKTVAEHLRAWEADTSLRTRHSVVNLRIQAELLIFIAQTGMNWSQVIKLNVAKFEYQSYSDGYLVRRVFKGRRQGEVAFEIFSEYRPYFERYLAWRCSFFGDDESGLLFPLIGRAKRDRTYGFASNLLRPVRRACESIGVDYVGPTLLRKIRSNWLVRRSGDLDQTAQMGQHTKQVLLRNYLEPDPDVAAVEISNFFSQTDLAIASAGPGACVTSAPAPFSNIPIEAPHPDCINPAGCLFCSHHRDIDSADHIWSLVSYRYLKTLELALYRAPARRNETHPAAAVIDRLTEKIGFFAEDSEIRKQWLEEAKSRVKESDFHPMWNGFIEIAEALV